MKGKELLLVTCTSILQPALRYVGTAGRQNTVERGPWGKLLTRDCEL